MSVIRKIFKACSHSQVMPIGIRMMSTVLQNQQIRRMCYYSSSEEDEPDYLHFRKLLNFPLASGFAAKHTTLKTCSPLKVLQNQQIRRMCYYSSEEDEPDYLHFRNLLNFPLASGFAAKHTTFFREMILRDPSVLMEEGTVWKLIHGVVVPNILIRPEDEDLFESDYRGFINREKDSESRRRGACILFGRMVRGCEEARAVSFEEVIKLVESGNWKEKECGILLAATMVGSPTVLLDTRQFAKRRIIPLLLHLDGFPMIKATALWLLTVAAHRGRVSITWRADVLEALNLMLQENSKVVQSYASICLRKLFVDRDSSDGHDEALANLFLAFQNSEYNPYIMRCIYQVLSVSEISDEVAELCFRELLFLLSKSCQNPEFEENLYSSLGVLIKRATHERLFHLMEIFGEIVSSPPDDTRKP